MELEDELVVAPRYTKKVHAAFRYAATFHNEVEELVNMEKINEEKLA